MVDKNKFSPKRRARDVYLSLRKKEKIDLSKMQIPDAFKERKPIFLQKFVGTFGTNIKNELRSTQNDILW